MSRDAGSQCREPERLGIAEPAGYQRRPRRCDGAGWRRRRGLPDLHVDDAPARFFYARGRRHHVHHHERREHRCAAKA